MKKTISILLIVTMLFSLAIAAIPASAAQDAPVALDPDTVGNNVITDANREEYQEQLRNEGYIPLVNDVLDSHPEGTKSFASIFSKDDGKNPDGKNIADGNKFFLLEPIVAGRVYKATNKTGEYVDIHGKTKTYRDGDCVSNFILDGCGYFIQVSNPLFREAQDVTFKNVTFTGTVDMGTTNKCGAFSVIAQWNQFDSCNFYNVTSEVTVKSINRAGTQHAVNLALYGTDCVFNNVKVSSDDTLGADATRVDDMGALIGRVEGKSVFENCVATGNLYVNAKTLAGVDGIGGLVGKVQSGTATFKNCANYRNIIISADTVFQSDYVSHDTDFVKDEAGNATTEIKKGSASQNTTVGGIVGRIKGAATLENCVNAGKIEFGGKVTIKDKAIGVGGIVGMIENEVTMTNCANTGVLDMKFDASFEGTTTQGGKELKSATPLHRRTYIGGVAGYGNAKKIAFENCSNSGAITLDNCATAGLGGVIGCVEGGATGHTFTNCDNSGEIKFQNGAKLNQPSDNGMGLGGVLGISKASNVALTDCDNSAKVTYTLIGGSIKSTEKYTNADGKEVDFTFHTGVCGVGGVMGYQYLSSAYELSLIDCDNTGALTRSSETDNDRFLGGVIGGVRGVKNVLVDKCTNSSDLAAPSGGRWASTGGIVGQYASIGNWMHDGNSGIEATFDIRRCTNTGNITSVVDAGGMLGANNEIEATKLVTTFYDCVNQGNVTVTGKAYAGGMYGIANTKGTINFEYCVNSGAISSNSSAGGLVSVVEAKLTNFLVTNCKNEGAVTANATTTPRAGGLAARIAVADGGKVEILNSANTGAVESKGDTANGIAGGIAGCIADVTATMNGNVNKGTVKCATASAAAPIVANQTKLASGTNYYLKGCATGSFTHGTAEASVDTRLASMVFAVSGDSFHLKKLIASVATLVQSDYEPATWTDYTNVLAAANTVANNVSTQAAIDEAKANLEAKIAALDPKALDLTKYNEVMGKFDELDPGAWSGNSFLVVTEAVKVVEAIKADENGLQSKFDVALQAVLDAIGDLEVRDEPGGTIDVEQKGQLTLPPLRPQKTTASTPEATEPTEESTTTAATTAAKKRGCGGLIGGATVVATAVLAIGVGVSLKKKED